MVWRRGVSGILRARGRGLAILHTAWRTSGHLSALKLVPSARCSGVPCNFANDGLEDDQVVSQIIALGAQVTEIGHPPLFIATHGSKDLCNVAILGRPATLNACEVGVELFGGSDAHVDVMHGGIHGVCSALNDLLNLLVAIEQLGAELLVVQHGVEDVHVLHGQLEISDALFDILDGQIKVCSGAFEEAVNIVDVALQDENDLLVRFGLAFLQQVHAKDDLCHQLDKRVVFGTGFLLPSSDSSSSSAIVLRLEQSPSSHCSRRARSLVVVVVGVGVGVAVVDGSNSVPYRLLKCSLHLGDGVDRRSHVEVVIPSILFLLVVVSPGPGGQLTKLVLLRAPLIDTIGDTDLVVVSGHLPATARMAYSTAGGSGVAYACCGR